MFVDGCRAEVVYLALFLLACGLLSLLVDMLSHLIFFAVVHCVAHADVLLEPFIVALFLD